jgi:hypothetical protein
VNIERRHRTAEELLALPENDTSLPKYKRCICPTCGKVHADPVPGGADSRISPGGRLISPCTGCAPKPPKIRPRKYLAGQRLLPFMSDEGLQDGPQ